MTLQIENLIAISNMGRKCRCCGAAAAASHKFGSSTVVYMCKSCANTVFNNIVGAVVIAQCIKRMG